MSHQLLALRLRLIDSSPDVAKFIEERHALRTKSWEPGFTMVASVLGVIGSLALTFYVLATG